MVAVSDSARAVLVELLTAYAARRPGGDEGGAMQVLDAEVLVPGRPGIVSVVAQFEAGIDSYTGSLGNQGAPVRVVTIDSLCTAAKLPQPDLVKIDVEGAEALVLRGARETIRLAQPVVFVAVHGPAVRTECLELLQGFGYAAEELSGRGIEPGTEFVARPLGERLTGPGSARVR